MPVLPTSNAQSKRWQSGRARTDLLGRSILLVGGGFDDARDIKQALQHAGALVYGPFPDESSALRCLATRNPSCAVLDAQPRSDVALCVAQALQEKSAPFVLLAGSAPVPVPPTLAAAPMFSRPISYRALLKTTASISKGRWS